MYQITPVTGHLGGECFLITSEQSAVLIDSGFDFCSETTANNIATALGGRPLDYVLSTHTHYDHMSGIPGIRQHFPMLKSVASRQSANLVPKVGVQDLMRSLNAACAQDTGIILSADRIDQLAVDIALEDGDTLCLPDMTIRAVATPGHTRCAMSYFFEEEELLVCSETLGITPKYPEVIPCFIVSYRSTLDSIERSRALQPRHVFVSHHGLIPDGDGELFFKNARLAAEKAMELLVGMHDRGCDEEEIVVAFRDMFYAPCADMQPERAFDLNTRALIPRILEELGRATATKTA